MRQLQKEWAPERPPTMRSVGSDLNKEIVAQPFLKYQDLQSWGCVCKVEIFWAAAAQDNHPIS